MQEQVQFEPKTVGEIFAVISPILNPNQRTQFIGLARSLGACWKVAQELTEEIDALVMPSNEDLKYTNDLLADIKRRREITEQFVYHPKNPFTKGRLEALLGRLQVGLCLVAEHPWLSPLTREQFLAQEFHYKAEDSHKKAQDEIENKLKPQLKKTESDIEKTEGHLLDFSESEVISFLSNAISYAKILPQRSDELARRYGQAFGLDPERITSLDELMKLINPYVEARAKRNKNFSLLLEQRPLFDIPAKDLPEPIQHRLQVWTSYQFSLLLAQEGIIDKPELPDLLRRL